MSTRAERPRYSRFGGALRQLFGLVPRKRIEALAREEDADRYYKKFFAVEHLRLALCFVLLKLRSLRELAEAILPGGRLAPRGAEKPVVGRSQLTDAFARRPWMFFAKVYADLVLALQRRIRGPSDKLLAGVRAIDGSILELVHRLVETFPGFKKEASAKLTLRLNLANLLPESLVLTPGRKSDHRCIDQLIEWTRKGITYIFDRGYFKLDFFRRLDESGNFFITRWKESSFGRVIKEVKTYAGRWTSGFRLHQELLVELGEDPENAFPGPIRAILAFDERGHLWVLLTNRVDLTALEVCEIYRRRWAIETFWRTLKRTMDMRELKVANLNAVMIMVLVTLIAYVLADALILMHRARHTLAEAFYLLCNLDTWLADEVNQLLCATGPPSPSRARHLPTHRALFISVALEGLRP